MSFSNLVIWRLRTYPHQDMRLIKGRRAATARLQFGTFGVTTTILVGEGASLYSRAGRRAVPASGFDNAACCRSESKGCNCTDPGEAALLFSFFSFCCFELFAAVLLFWMQKICHLNRKGVHLI